MNKKIYKYFFLFLFINSNSISALRRINCNLIPIFRLSSRNSCGINTRFNISHLRIPLKFGTSTNWGGFAALTSFVNPKNHSVTRVVGSWRAPQVVISSNDTYAAFWVGIDGYASNTVEQIGTEHESISGNLVSYAWFEMYPRQAFLIQNFPVNPGDVIAASVTYIGNHTFNLKIVNKTRNVFTTIPQSFTKMPNAKRSSAEWIVEAPFLNGTLPLANFGTVKFTNCRATINGVNGGIRNNHWVRDRIRMVTTNGTTKSFTSPVLSDNQSFRVKWNHQ